MHRGRRVADAPASDHSSSPEVLQPAIAPVAPERLRRNRLRREPRFEGPISCAALIVDPTLIEPAIFEEEASRLGVAERRGGADAPEGELFLIGLIQCKWIFGALDNGSREAQLMRQQVRKKRCPFLGWVDWFVHSRKSASAPRALYHSSSIRRVREAVESDDALRTQARSWGAYLTEYFIVGAWLAEMVLAGWTCILSIPILSKYNNRLWPASSRRPPTGLMRKFVKSQMHGCVSEMAAVSRVNHTARKLGWRKASDMLRFLDASSFLLNQAQLEAASRAFVRALWPKAARHMLEELERSGFQYPSRSECRRGRPRLDLVCAALARRKFVSGQWSRDSSCGRSIHMYIDSSPATGREIYGIVADIFAQTTRVLWMLPAIVLGHGYMSAMDKTVATLWSIFLITGPQGICAFLQDVRSITCDFGTESAVADAKNITDVWARHLGIPAAVFQGLDSYLFPNAVFLPDWNHLWCNIQKRALESLDSWGTVLPQLQTLCKFFKNDEYREILAKHARSEGAIEMATRLKRFNASFARWRYETVDKVLRALHAIREYCENIFSSEILGSVQDASELRKVYNCCKNKPLWRWISAMHLLWSFMVDQWRNWGRGCRCHEEQRSKGQHVVCEMKTRRLREAASFIEEAEKDFFANAEHLIPDDCEGDEWVFFEVRQAMRMTGDVYSTFLGL